jgi:DNA-binding transcriptional MerR regulator
VHELEEVVQNLVPIGRFSLVCRLTVKALRHYDELGLLRPAFVDDSSGYRYYSLTQASDAERIVRLRALDMPLEDIREVMRAPNAAAAKALLEAHRERLKGRLQTTQQALTFLQGLIDGKEISMSYDVSIQQLSSQAILSIRMKTSAKELGQTAGQAFGELFAYLGQVGVRPVGPPFVLYHDEDFRDEDLDVEYCVPTEKRVAGAGRTNGRELEAVAAACTLHAGAYDSIGGGYRAVAEWMQAHGHESAGAPREVYLVGPDTTTDPRDWRTQIAWPIR